MYPAGATSSVSVGRLGEVLEGEVRPGHFAGVATVVAKLFNIVGPQRAFFGQKDAQQLAVVRRMTADLSFDIEVVACPTVRASDGVALGTRNRYLSAEDRTRADRAVALPRRGAAGVPLVARFRDSREGDVGRPDLDRWRRPRLRGGSRSGVLRASTQGRPHTSCGSGARRFNPAL